jgi:hypothetical protein
VAKKEERKRKKNVAGAFPRSGPGHVDGMGIDYESQRSSRRKSDFFRKKERKQKTSSP